MTDTNTASTGSDANASSANANATDPNKNTTAAQKGATGGDSTTASKTLAQGGTDDTKGAATGKWDGWREELAAGDAKVLKRLERFATPKELKDSYFALDQRLSAGELKAQLAKDATPEQIAEYRKANGIPETADKYEIKLPDGLIIGESETPILDKFKEFALNKNWTSEQVSQGTEWFLKQQAVEIAQKAEADVEWRGKNEDTLRTEWGTDFKGNTGKIHAMLDGLPDQEAADYIFNARGEDGRLVCDSPKALKALLYLANEAGFDTAMSGAGSGGEGTSLEAEMKTLEVKQGGANYTNEDRKRYIELTDIKLARDSRGKRKSA